MEHTGGSPAPRCWFDPRRWAAVSSRSKYGRPRQENRPGKPAQEQMMARPDLCISCDSHVVETPEIFDGLEKRFGELAPKIVYDPKRGDVLHIAGRAGLTVGRFGIAGHFANDPETQEMMRMGYKGLRPGIIDPVERLRDQDLDGVDAEVLLPSVMFGVYPVNNSDL